MKKLLLLCFVFSASLAFGGGIPNFNSAAQNTLSSTQESLIGLDFFREMRKVLPFVRDEFVNQYVSQLGQRLVAHSPKPQGHYEFFVIRDKEINAFAGPGGYIVINAGIVLIADTPGELASVMAHELAHVVQRHIARGIESAKKDQLLSAASILASIAGGGAGAASAGMAGSFEHGMRTSRQFEQEADRIGMQILKRAGFQANDMTTFLKKMDKASGSAPDDEFSELFASHPSAGHRVADAEYRSDNANHSKTNLNFQLIQARTLVDITEQPNSALRKLKKQMAKQTTLASKYAYALLLIKANKAHQAVARLESINQQKPENTLIEAGLAQALLADNKTQAAFKLLATTHHYTPENTALSLFYAKALIHHKQYKKALTVLNTIATPNSETYFYLAEAQGRSGELKAAYLNRAKYFLSLGEFHQASAQLHQALKIRHPKGLNFEIKRLQKRIS